MQLHVMLKIFVSDAWLALWIFFENFCSKIFGTTLQEVYNTFFSHSTAETEFCIHVVEICCKSEMFIKSYRYWLFN